MNPASRNYCSMQQQPTRFSGMCLLCEMNRCVWCLGGLLFVSLCPRCPLKGAGRHIRKMAAPYCTDWIRRAVSSLKPSQQIIFFFLNHDVSKMDRHEEVNGTVDLWKDAESEVKMTKMTAGTFPRSRYCSGLTCPLERQWKWQEGDIIISCWSGQMSENVLIIKNRETLWIKLHNPVYCLD